MYRWNCWTFPFYAYLSYTRVQPNMYFFINPSFHLIISNSLPTRQKQTIYTKIHFYDLKRNSPRWNEWIHSKHPHPCLRFPSLLKHSPPLHTYRQLHRSPKNGRQYLPAIIKSISNWIHLPDIIGGHLGPLILCIKQSQIEHRVHLQCCHSHVIDLHLSWRILLSQR